MAWSAGPPGIMPAVRRAIVLAIAVLVVVPAAAQAAPVTLAKVGDFSAPVYVTAPLGDTARVFVVEKGGTIQVLDGAARSTFLDITSKVNSADEERGLLSMAFALDYSTSGLFYVYYTAKSPVGQVTIEEHRVDPANPDRADPSYARTVVTIPHDQQANHNGGQLQFGPDGLLYAGTGDGGSGGDPSGNAQTTAPAAPTVVNGVNHDYRLGKLLRIDPATGAVSIFAYGLRNPWRFSYDRNTGDLVIGDVGQDRYEEVDFAAAPGDGAGANYGWNQYEGLHTYPGNAPAGGAPGTVLPVIEYPHGPACSITGGYVVRDPALPELAGTYLYGDNCTGAISGATLPAGAARTLGFTVANVSSFGEDGCGRVYAASLGGAVYRFASSGACAGPAPFVGRLPAGVTGPPAGGPDRRAPVLTLLRAAARQHALRTGFVSIRVRCDELCTVRASGRVRITRGAHAAAAPPLRTRTARATLAAGAAKTLRLKLSKATRRAIGRSLARRGRRATVLISVRAADGAGNARSATRRVWIVR
ncbi:MAG TPA: PQQ-dependent sugar dehydrogenase [Solirubrobacteraceae bacterium]